MERLFANDLSIRRSDQYRAIGILFRVGVKQTRSIISHNVSSDCELDSWYSKPRSRGRWQSYARNTGLPDVTCDADWLAVRHGGDGVGSDSPASARNDPFFGFIPVSLELTCLLEKWGCRLVSTAIGLTNGSLILCPSRLADKINTPPTLVHPASARLPLARQNAPSINARAGVLLW